MADFDHTQLYQTAYDIGYTFILAAQDGGRRPTITVGDFAPLTNGQDYYDASVDFASDSGQKIKQLAGPTLDRYYVTELEGEHK